MSNPDLSGNIGIRGHKILSIIYQSIALATVRFVRFCLKSYHRKQQNKKPNINLNLVNPVNPVRKIFSAFPQSAFVKIHQNPSIFDHF
jgi:hypothetical protein